MFTYFGVMIGPPLFGAAAALAGFQGAYMPCRASGLGRRIPRIADAPRQLTKSRPAVIASCYTALNPSHEARLSPLISLRGRFRRSRTVRHRSRPWIEDGGLTPLD